MRQQSQEMDVESLQKSGRRRGSCLDVFLVVSIIFLFVAVAAVAVGGGMLMMELRSKVETPLKSVEVGGALRQTGATPEPVYKMEKFAYLEAISSTLNNSTMKLARVPYGSGVSVGSNFYFNEEHSSLKPLQRGNYFIYVELNLSCTGICTQGLLSVHVEDKLSCEVELQANATHMSKKCWTVSQLEDKPLITQMAVSGGLENWKLELRGSGLGMFLVD